MENEIYVAVVEEEVETVADLIAKGANVNSMRQWDETTLLYLAVESNNFEISKLLLDAGANPNAAKWDTLIQLSVQSNNIDITKLLIKAGADVNETMVLLGMTPLQWAVNSNNIEIVKLLVNAGADVNAYTSSLESPLEMAIQRRNVNLIKFFLNFIPDVNSIKNKFGTQALHLAVHSGNSRVVKLLLDAGADVNVKNNDETTLHEAVRAENVRILKLFLSAGAEVNEPDGSGNTPLHYAAEFNKILACPLILKLLIKAGADVNKCNNSNRTAFTHSVDEFTLLVETDLMARDTDLIKIYLKLLLEYTDMNLTDKENKNILTNVLMSDRSTWRREIFSKVILEHVAKLTLMDLPIDSILLNTIILRGDDSQYFTRCIKELERAKKTKLRNCWVTFFNLIIDNVSKFVKYAGNKNLVKEFRKNVRRFPIYGMEMQNKMLKGMVSHKSFEEAAKNLSHHLPIFDPYHLVIRSILDTLSIKDWKNLCENKRCREYCQS